MKYVLYDILNVVISGSKGFGSKFNYYGFPTGGLYSLFNYYSKYEKSGDYKQIFCLDHKGRKNKMKKFDDYKANRKSDSDIFKKILTTQIDYIRDISLDCDIPIYEIEGYEADDIIYSLVKNISLEDPDAEFTIISFDGDYAFLSLINGRVKFERVGNHKVNLDRSKFVYKVVYGDKDDNIFPIRVEGLSRNQSKELSNRLYTMLSEKEDMYMKYNFNPDDVLNEFNFSDVIRESIYKNLYLVHPFIKEDIKYIDKEVNTELLINYLKVIGLNKSLKVINPFNKYSYDDKLIKLLSNKYFSKVDENMLEYFGEKTYSN